MAKITRPIDCTICNLRAKCVIGINAEALLRVGLGKVRRQDCYKLNGGKLISPQKNQITRS